MSPEKIGQAMVASSRVTVLDYEPVLIRDVTVVTERFWNLLSSAKQLETFVANRYITPPTHRLVIVPTFLSLLHVLRAAQNELLRLLSAHTATPLEGLLTQEWVRVHCLMELPLLEKKCN